MQYHYSYGFLSSLAIVSWTPCSFILSIQNNWSKKNEAIAANLVLNIHLATVARPQRTSVFKASILHSFFSPIPGNHFSGMITFKELALNVLSLQVGQAMCVKSISMSQELNLNLYW